MTSLEDAMLRSRILAERIKLRTDDHHRKIIKQHSKERSFKDYENLAISPKAWRYVADSGISPHMVFAHPDLLASYPETSQYYRGIALLSQKQVQGIAGNVGNWENRSYKRLPTAKRCLNVVRLYNSVISSIIEGTSDWTLENGYRNILATMGISLDGFMRNKIGRDAEELIKIRIVNWLKEKKLTDESADSIEFHLPNETIMRYGSEPDIEISRNGKTLATIEIKGGKDPAGALERLGAMQKSFAETPPGCQNFLVAGVITPEMKARLNEIGTVKVFELDYLSYDNKQWDLFVNEIFHYAVRII